MVPPAKKFFTPSQEIKQTIRLVGWIEEIIV